MKRLQLSSLMTIQELLLTDEVLQLLYKAVGQHDALLIL